MIFNIRGTSGSGKTYIVYHLMEEYRAEPLLKSDGKIEGYFLPTLNMRILGRYTTRTGGCDTIHTQQEAEDLIRLYHQKGHVLFEGLLISHLWSRWLGLSQDLGKDQLQWCFLDTPVDVCIERVVINRGGKGKDDHRNLRQKHVDVERVMAKALAAGEDVHVLRWQTAYEDFIALLKEKGCIPA